MAVDPGERLDDLEDREINVFHVETAVTPEACPNPHILILAAGSSTRMRGGDKLLERVDGVAQIARAAGSALATGCPVWIALSPDHPARVAALTDIPVKLMIVADAHSGMAASIGAGVAAIPEDVPILILLADLPEITTSDLSTMIKTHQAEPRMIHRATATDGRPGHPVIFPAMLRSALLSLTGDQGARDVLRLHSAQVRAVPLPGDHAITDLDTPEDWARWRACRR